MSWQTIRPNGQIPVECGVYVLYYADGTRYVGKSKNLPARVRRWQRTGCPHCDHVVRIRVLPVPEGGISLDNTEQAVVVHTIDRIGRARVRNRIDFNVDNYDRWWAA